MAAIVRPAALILVVTALLCVAMLTTDTMNFRSGWNLLWMLAIPFGVAWVYDRRFNRGGVWPLVGLFLLVWSLFAMGLIAAVLGIGP